jgi:hypothetical protein
VEVDLAREIFRTPVLNRFIEYYDTKTRSVSKDSIITIDTEISDVRGLYDDVDGFPDSVPIIKKAIKGDILNAVVLQDEGIQKMDLALEKIMKNGNSEGNGDQRKKNVKSNDDDEYEEDDDGNEWDD